MYEKALRYGQNFFTRSKLIEIILNLFINPQNSEMKLIC